ARPRSPPVQQMRGSGAPLGSSSTRRPLRAPRTSTRASPRSCRRQQATALSASAGATTATTLPSLGTWSGSSPNSSLAPRPTGHSGRAYSTPPSPGGSRRRGAGGHAGDFRLVREVRQRGAGAPPHPRLVALEDRCVPSAGQLDPTFGSGGTVKTQVSTG